MARDAPQSPELQPLTDAVVALVEEEAEGLDPDTTALTVLSLAEFWDSEGYDETEESEEE